jgi:peptidoglycan/LPS O-acetylase OafA/YrhL
MKFRYDINALRALAVAAVVLFHYKVTFVSGGFVGVDIFFVISGYLMTAIIAGRLTAGKFRLWEFYYDRAKRIVPGLLGMCFVLIAAGYFVLEPATYHYLGSTSIAALLFFSNFRFWETTPYFDPQSDVKWLLHTWSLSVEGQFYLAYPILLMGLHKFEKTRRHILPVLWVLALLSLVSCVWLSLSQPPTAFYLLPPRAWELIAGGIVALQFPNDRKRYASTLLASGFLLIGASIVLYDKNMPWPYFSGILPVLGTCLIIAANRGDARIFQIEIIQKIGRWSYSIYLWHWPVAVTAIYFGFKNATPEKIAAQIIIIAAILEAGWILLSLPGRLIEARLTVSRWPGLLGGACALGLTLAFAGVVTVNQGLASRRPDGVQQYNAYEIAQSDWDYPETCNGTDASGNLRPCRLGAAGDRGILFIGDSFAMQIYGRFAEIAKRDPGSSFTFLASSSCPPVTGIRVVHDQFKCNGFIEKALQFAKARHFARIMLVSNWEAYFRPEFGNICFEIAGGCQTQREPQSFYLLLDGAFSTLGSRLLELKNSGAEIVIIGTTPSGTWNVPAELARRKFLGRDTADVEFIDRAQFDDYTYPVKSRLMTLAAAIGGKFVDPLGYLCDNHRCPTVDSEGAPYFRDECHYRSAAVKTSRFEFLDDATGLRRRVSAAPMAGNGAPNL